MAKLKRGSKFVCVPCGRQVTLDCCGVSQKTIWCCGRPMKSKAKKALAKKHKKSKKK